MIKLTTKTEAAPCSSPRPGRQGQPSSCAPKPRPSCADQVAVGAQPARLISRGRWKGAGEGKKEKSANELVWELSRDSTGAGLRCTYGAAGSGPRLRSKPGRRGRRPGRGPGSLGLACGWEAGLARAVVASCYWLQFWARCRLEGEAQGARTERPGGLASRGEGPGRWRRRRRRWRRGPVLDPAG